VTDPVTSPSFTIGQLYRGRVPVSHVDLFRLDSLTGEDPGLLSDYLMPDRVTFIEWPGAGVAEVEPQRVVLSLRLAAP
jgi:tRNA threonylcarbamoyladenosine biosynthesis protein TsaE